MTVQVTEQVRERVQWKHRKKRECSCYLFDVHVMIKKLGVRVIYQSLKGIIRNRSYCEKSTNPSLHKFNYKLLPAILLPGNQSNKLRTHLTRNE